MATSDHGTLRRRNHHTTSLTDQNNDEDEVEPLLPSNSNNDKKVKPSSKKELESRPTYWLTSLLILRSIAIIYFLGFCVAYVQNHALIGVSGIYPYTQFLNRMESSSAEQFDTNWNKYVNLPTLLWFMPKTNDSLDQIAICGMILSLSVIIFGYYFCHMFIFLSLWILYHSLVNVGGLFYGYGWESQVLETGFLAIFLCRFKPFPWKYNVNVKNKSTQSSNSFQSFEQKPDIPPSYIVLYLYLWLIFRIILGAGLIKIRAGQCWIDYTCMDYHYETQPNPNPISWIMHNNPHWFHQTEVAVNHFVELIAPWFILIPFRNITLISGLIQIFFQFLIICGGNLSFLNWLTIIPSLAALDDSFCNHYLWFLFTNKERNYLYNKCAKYYIKYQQQERRIETQRSFIVNESFDSTLFWRRFKPCSVYSFGDLLYKGLAICVLIVIGYLSRDVVKNLVSSRQIMNTSFDKFRLVNTYGAFGTVGHERFEVVFSMATDEYIDDDTQWIEILFKCKPGPLDRRPCQITPYHYRLDWQIWFAGFEPHTPNRHPWIFMFVAQLLSHDMDTIQLLDTSVEKYLSNHNITFIKADMYKYEFTKKWTDKDWWTREMRGTYLPALNLKNRQFQDILRQLQWSGRVKRKKKSKKKNRRRK